MRLTKQLKQHIQCWSLIGQAVGEEARKEEVDTKKTLWDESNHWETRPQERTPLALQRKNPFFALDRRLPLCESFSGGGKLIRTRGTFALKARSLPRRCRGNGLDFRVPQSPKTPGLIERYALYYVAPVFLENRWSIVD